ncbi:MAG: rhodanese-related sulfurtransferase [Bacteroidota bacterium]|nr:rhodanese-related sulfurtransferase [Bacteroidota bacterium]
MNYSILLYYCYTKIEDPEKFREEHHLYCLENDLRGRIIIAGEGINGTVSGTKEHCEKYMRDLKADPRFAEIDFKVEGHDKHGFQKLHVRVKPEIVHSGLDYINPRIKSGKYLTPEAFKKMKQDPDVVVLDVRSNYEHSLGKFHNAVTLDLENFRDFPQKIEELENYKDKKIITYCTGGIKCEKASAYLLEKGFKDVYQLHGGIIKYGIESGGEDFVGKCYVFDNRIAANVNRVNPVIISKCHICKTASDRMINCANPVCNNHVPVCEKCGWEMEGACTVACKEHLEKRPYDGTGYYQKEMNGYNPLKGLVRKNKSTKNVPKIPRT